MTQVLTAQRVQQGPLHSSDRSGIEQHETSRDEGPAVIRFRRFQVLPGARQLRADGEPIELGSRAFDLLVALLQELRADLPTGRGGGRRSLRPFQPSDIRDVYLARPSWA